VYDVEGKTAVITGAASGMGLAMAWSFAGAGMSVVLADIDDEGLDAAVGRLTDAGHQAVAQRTDVRHLVEIEALRDAALDAFGAVHVVCNNAGIGIGGAVEEMSLEDWTWTLDIDLWGVIHGVRTFLPLLKEQGEGHLSATSSLAGLSCGPSLGAYHVAKHGVVALMDTVRVELRLAESPVRASVLCPGPIDTEIVRSSRRHHGDDVASSDGGFMDQLEGHLRKGMDPAEVGDLVLDAVVNERFWVLTHPEMELDAVQRRLDRMRADHAHRI